MLAVTANGHLELYKLSDVAHLVAGSIGIIDRDGYGSLAGVESVFLYIGAVDGTTSTPAVKKGAGRQGLGPSAGIQLDVQHEVISPTRPPPDIANWFAEFIKPFPG